MTVRFLDLTAALVLIGAGAAAAAQAPPIVVEQPRPGAAVRSPITVRGTADVFEARLDVDVVAPNGRLLAHRALMASAGTGTRGRFRTSIALPGRVGRVTIVVYTRSPRDGSRIDTVRIPVTLRR